MKTKLLWLALVVAAIWGMKRYYADARADDLWWILGPTSRLAGALTRSEFVVEPGAGYLSRQRLFLIEKSCAGINFMIAAFGMVAFVLRRRVRSFWSAAGALTASVGASYAAAVFVNAARIALAMWLAAHSLALSSAAAADLHRIEGIAVYFGGLMLLYELARRFDRGAALAGSRT